MKCNKLLILCVFIFSIFMITAVSASDDSVFTNDSVSTPDDSGVGAAQDYDKKIYVNTTGDDSNVGSVVVLMLL